MYSEVVGSLGVSQGTMEAIVITGIIVAVVGVVLVLFWKYIIMGALAIGCVAVMANHKSNDSFPKKEEIVNEVKIDNETTTKVAAPTSKIDEPKDIRKEFMDKCINLADYTRTQCDEIWDDRVKEERVLLDDSKQEGKTNGSYN